MKPLIVFVFIIYTTVAIDFQCRDQRNNPVDWFVFYKIPRLKSSDNVIIQNGDAFIYFDSNYKQWTLSNVGMVSKDQPIAYTLQQYYDNSNNPEVFSIMYSDQLPYPRNGTWSSTSGHCKGVTVFSETSGFWLIHSIPKFPRNDTYEYPSNAHRYGQMGICISLPYAALSYIATQLYFMRPFIYSASLPTIIASNIPLLGMVIAGRYQMERPFTSTAYLLTTQNHPFIHFAKAGLFGKDIYFDLIAPSLRVSLKTETWQHQSGTSKNLFSWCRSPNPYQVFNAKQVTLPFNITFPNYDDHAKYAVATDTQGGFSYPWVCIGGINRQSHQLERGGGVLCTADAQLYAAFSTIISEYWPCRGSEM